MHLVSSSITSHCAFLRQSLIDPGAHQLPRFDGQQAMGINMGVEDLNSVLLLG